MVFVSYAQNFEDVMLHRALADVAHGFWIDVGAADHEQYSVTRAFAGRGWRGVNVEPTPAAFARLLAARPHDINLRLAIGAAPGTLTFHECEDATLSTLDAAVAAGHRAAGLAVEDHEIEVMTLAELCRRHAPQTVHFLKIDVEGAEAAVLAGADFAACRPWILVIEAIAPGTTREAHEGWEPAVLAAGYRFAWFDGVNRFYLADEHWERLSPHFRLPPNTTDGFILAASVQDGEVLARLRRAEAELGRIRAERDLLRAVLARPEQGGGWPLRMARRARGWLLRPIALALADLRGDRAA